MRNGKWLQTLKLMSNKHGSPPHISHIFAHTSIIQMYPKPVKILRPVGVHATVSPIVNMGQVCGQRIQRSSDNETSAVKIGTSWKSWPPSRPHQHTREDLTHNHLGNWVYSRTITRGRTWHTTTSTTESTAATSLAKSTILLARLTGSIWEADKSLVPMSSMTPRTARSRTSGNSCIKPSRVRPPMPR